MYYDHVFTSILCLRKINSTSNVLFLNYTLPKNKILACRLYSNVTEKRHQNCHKVSIVTIVSSIKNLKKVLFFLHAENNCIMIKCIKSFYSTQYILNDKKLYRPLNKISPRRKIT